MQTETRLQALNDLDQHQLRVLGCLAEKQLASPKTYPLTLNATLLACNQKTGRSPVMTLDLGQVQRALVSLRLLNLVHVQYGSRHPRYSHLLNRHLGLELPQFAILTALLLSGPLSPADIATATKRLYVFSDIAAVESALITSQLFEPSLRMNGQRSERFRHTLGGSYKTPAVIRSSHRSLASVTSSAVLVKEPGLDALEQATAVHKSKQDPINTVVNELRQLQLLLDPASKPMSATTQTAQAKRTGSSG